MKREYKAPVMEDLGSIMTKTKGTTGFGFHDLLRVLIGEASLSEFDSLLELAQNPAS